MRIVLAVIDDLFQFARTALFGIDTISRTQEYIPLPSTFQPALSPSIFEINTTSPSTAIAPNTESFSSVSGVYFIGSEKVALHTDPVLAFDVAFDVLTYGDQVHVVKLGGRWAYVRTEKGEGWIFKDVLREQVRDVFPFFEEGKVYDATNSETKKARMTISDMFGGEVAELILTDAEYAMYKLKRKQRSFPWDNERPRTPGTWQKKLRGKPGVHIGIAPKTDSIMEYVVDDVGHVAYVDSVFPDETIKLSAVGLTQEGVYTDTMLQKDQWKELRPVFIEAN